jgi:uncharacterized membrane protein YidH (DUF202 family)
MTRAGRATNLAGKPGLQEERTELAWERSALGLLAGAALLLLRHIDPAIGRVLLVAAQIGLASLTVWYGRRRGRQVRGSGTGAERPVLLPDARVELVGITIAMVAISVGTTVMILLAG